MSDISACNKWNFYHLPSVISLLKIHRENDNSKIKISYFFLYSIAAYKVKENDIKILEIFNSPNVISPKVATRQNPFRKDSREDLPIFLGKILIVILLFRYIFDGGGGLAGTSVKYNMKSRTL